MTKSLGPDLYEKILAVAAFGLFLLVSIALFRGRAAWTEVGPIVWLHLSVIMVALALTPFQLVRRRGDQWHRLLGWVWAASLFGTAIISFAIRDINHGGFSIIHILSVVTAVNVPILVYAARHHQIARHRGAVRGLVTGALLIAGYFTLMPGRVLGAWLWG